MFIHMINAQEMQGDRYISVFSSLQETRAFHEHISKCPGFDEVWGRDFSGSAFFSDFFHPAFPHT